MEKNKKHINGEDLDPKRNDEFIALLKEIKIRDDLIKSIKDKIIEKDILIEQLSKVLTQKGKAIKIPTNKNNQIFYNLTNAISHFEMNIFQEKEAKLFPTQLPYRVTNKIFEVEKQPNDIIIISKSNILQELNKSRGIIEIMNKEKLRLTSKLNSNKIKMKQLMKLVNEKFSFYTQKNHLLSQSISQITNNITKAEKEKYDLESVIFCQEDKITQLNNKINVLLEVIEQKDELLLKNKYKISELNEMLSNYQQLNGSMMGKKKSNNSLLIKNYSSSGMIVPKPKNNIKLKANISRINLNLSNSRGYSDRGILKLIDKSINEDKNNEKESEKLLIENKLNKVNEQKNKKRLSEVKQMINNLMNEISQ